MSWRTMATWQSRRSRWPRDRDPRSGRPYWQRAAATFGAAEILRARPASHFCIPPDRSTVSHHATVLAPYPPIAERPSPGAQQVPSGLEGSVASLAKGRCVIRGLPVHLMILRWPDGPVAMPWPRSGRTVRDRRRARRSGPRRQCRPGGRTSRPGPCAARASPRSP